MKQTIKIIMMIVTIMSCVGCDQATKRKLPCQVDSFKVEFLV
jgi:type III secretory pathway lipoprotein EscJ